MKSSKKEKSEDLAAKTSGQDSDKNILDCLKDVELSIGNIDAYVKLRLQDSSFSEPDRKEAEEAYKTYLKGFRAYAAVVRNDLERLRAKNNGSA